MGTCGTVVTIRRGAGQHGCPRAVSRDPVEGPGSQGGRSVILVREKILDNGTISVYVSGVLDQTAVPILKDVCDRHLGAGMHVLVDLEAVVHITREGRSFLQEIQGQVRISHLPAFMAPEGNP